MKCKYLSDDFSAICVNDGCPAVADFCPCVNYPEICKHAKLIEEEKQNEPGTEKEAGEG